LSHKLHANSLLLWEDKEPPRRLAKIPAAAMERFAVPLTFPCVPFFFSSLILFNYLTKDATYSRLSGSGRASPRRNFGTKEGQATGAATMTRGAGQSAAGGTGRDIQINPLAPAPTAAMLQNM
jgi:hypothetical protein